MIRYAEQQVREATVQNVRLRGRAALLEMLSSTLAVFGMFTVVIGVAATTSVRLLVVSAIPVLTAGCTALWARRVRRQLARNERRIEKTVSDFNERIGYPESSLVWRNDGVRSGDPASMAELH